MEIFPPSDSALLRPLPSQPEGVPWPSAEWPTGPIPAAVDAARLEELLDEAYGPDADPRFGQSFATVIVQGGRIVAERYGPTSGPDVPHLSWSMAKSITQALVGVLVADGLLDPAAPAAVPEWSNPSDPRHEITLDQLLRMVDGLDFCESYELPDTVGDSPAADKNAAGGDPEVPFSHCIDMLFGAGAGDHAGYTAALPLAHAPGTVFNYSSGTANIVARIACDLIGRGDAAEAWMRERLFDPIGMASAKPSFDTAGNFVGSSFFHATARDYARFGLLYLRGGLWGDGDESSQVVPSSWVDYARTTRATDDDGGIYGAHWWLAGDNRGTFYPSGYEWQRVMCVPATDLIIVRLGKTLEADYEIPVNWMKSLITTFDPLFL